METERSSVSTRLDGRLGDSERIPLHGSILLTTNTADENDAYYSLENGYIKPFSGNGLKICHVNINSLPAKIDDLKYTLKYNPFDIIAITETHCDETIPDSELLIEDYNIIRKDRTRHGGGVALYIRRDINYTRLDYVNELEAICVKVKVSRNETLLSCVLYRPPNVPVEYFDQISCMMERAISDDVEMILLGDFNCDLCQDRLNSDAKHLSSLMTGFLCTQLVNVPTRVTMSSKSIIDHIYSTNPDKHIVTGVYKTFFSDHFLTFTIYGESCHKPLENLISWRDFSKFDYEGFVVSMAQKPFNDIFQITDVNEAWEKWYNLTMEVVNKFAPLKSKRMRRNPCPWVSGDTIQLMNTRDHFHKKALQTKSDLMWNRYKHYRNLVNRMVNQQKKAYIDSLLQENKGNPGALWKTLKSLTNANVSEKITLQVSGNEITDSGEVANIFSNYFSSAVKS